MATLISRSPEETFAIGQAWGATAPDGWVLGLSGDLGAGKTQLVRGLAAGLGCPGRVHSPTFTLVNEYPGGRLPLAHLDLYRLESAAALQSAGLEDYLAAPDGVVVVEWFERWIEAGLRPGTGRLRRVMITCRTGDEREITYDDTGA